MPRRSPERRASTVGVFAEHQKVFPGLPSDFAEFKRLVRTLSRTDALIWCARLNIHFGYPVKDAAHDVQQHFITLFLGRDEIDRINELVAQYGFVQVFFRGQILELMRWISLLCNDHDTDGTTFNDRETRTSFVRAALLASEVWGRRVYRDDFNSARVPSDALATMRMAHIEQTDGPDPFLSVARGAVVARHLKARLPGAEEAFYSRIGLTFEDYFSVLGYVAFLTRQHSVKDTDAPENSGLFMVDPQDATELSSKIRIWLRHEALTPAALREALWGDRLDSTEGEAAAFSLTPLKARPVLAMGDGRTIVLDASMFADRPTAGPLFHLVGGVSAGEANRTFGAFGLALEDYIHGVLVRIMPKSIHFALLQRFVASPTYRDRRGTKIELCDGIVIKGDVAVVFEAKAAWIREDATGPDASAQKYIEHLRSRYGISSSKRDGDRKVKGVGQLARAVRGLADANFRSDDFAVDGIRRVVPVLLVYDANLGAPLHANFLATEFATALNMETGGKMWRSMKVGKLDVDHLIVMTVDDLENLETSSELFPFVDFLLEYSNGSAERVESFHNYIVTSPHRHQLRGNRWLAKEWQELVEGALKSIFSKGR